MTIKAKEAVVDQTALWPLEGFKPFETHHCVTGSMLNIYHYNDHPLTEDMLLGLGAGLGFFYWHMKGQIPMLLGRGNVHRPNVAGLEIDTGRRSGVVVKRFVTHSAKKAQQALIQSLESQQPFMINTDMGFLPYFDLPEGYHFGQHVVVVAGLDLDAEKALLADRDGDFHEVSLVDLAQARGSTFKPFPPENTWYSFDFSKKRPPGAQDLWTAISDVCENMLRGPISNLGVRGIRRAANAIPAWEKQLDDDQLRETAFNGFIFIDAEGGTGGGMFRYMYSRFLSEAAEICGLEELESLSCDLQQIGDEWQAIAQEFKRVATHDSPVKLLNDLQEPLLAIADREQGLWEALDTLCAASPAR
jgi:hypothetical protein